MHFVDRGPEPAGLPAVRERLTPKWVAYYRTNQRKKPSDSQWRDFQPDLAKVFHDLCGYCEEARKGDVDHFRPKSRDPELVYEWSNWVYACHDCNGKKGDEWPAEGYVDPCATRKSEQPETYFDFDLLTAEIVPRDRLQGARRRRAVQMIRDLNWNSVPHRKNRASWVVAVTRLLDGRSATDAVAIAIVKDMTAPSHPNCSIIRKAAQSVLGA